MNELKPPLEGNDREAVVDLLYRLADDDLMIGHTQTLWTGLGPILEADIAVSSIAQDQIGHAVAYYRLLEELGEPDPDTQVYQREADKFRCCALACNADRDWAINTMREFCYETAKCIRLIDLSRSAYVPLAQLARKLCGEQKYHMMHARMWLDHLGDATDESQRRMKAALNDVYPLALGMFEPTPWDEHVKEKSIAPPEAELAKRWKAEIEPTLQEAGLTIPSGASPVYGGRQGKHPAALKDILAAIRKVYVLDPAAKW